MAWWVPLMAAGISAASSRSQQSSAVGLAKKQGAESREEAALNRAFQERMSSTAYQRSADDLEKAGLNRMLALGNPASSPGGNVAQIPDYAGASSAGAIAGATRAEKAFGAAMSTAQVQQSFATAKQIKAQEAQIKEATKGLQIENEMNEFKKGFEEYKYKQLMRAIEKGENILEGFNAKSGEKVGELKSMLKQLIKIIGSGYNPAMRAPSITYADKPDRNH